MRYKPIERYGLIGNMKSAALVGPDGSIDWLCLPRFDSPSIFAAILDVDQGGCFRLAPTESVLRASMHYWPDTNVLITRLRTSDGVGQIVDFMPVCLAKHDHALPELVRLISVEHGQMKVRMKCAPAFDYARCSHSIQVNGKAAHFTTDGAHLVLCGTVALDIEDGNAVSEFTLQGGQSAAWSLSHFPSEPNHDVCDVSCEEAFELLQDTVEFWKRWTGRCTYHGRWRELVTRSALALKLMTFEPSGAIIAAPTCSLPEHFGGTRNWDYRYTWIRDAAFTIYALQHIGYTDEAGAFMQWLEARSHELEDGGMLRPVYGVDGRHELPEEELHHLEGYRGSKPVRIGNAANHQLQIDVVGTLIDAAYLYDRDAVPISHSLWIELRKLLNWTCSNWRKQDHGVWEVRGEVRDFVYSKLMCWVALDRGIRLVRMRGFPGEVARWRRARDAIYKSIHSHGWNPNRRAFTQHYETDALDAANLIMPLVMFISPNDPRMLDTIRAMDRPLFEGGLISDYMVHRYDPKASNDGFDETEGAFKMCTFWLVEALTRAGYGDGKYLERARMLFERAIEHAHPLGLFAEQTAAEGHAAGNYPQALTHLSMIIAAYHLDRALSSRRCDYQHSPALEMQ